MGSLEAERQLKMMSNERRSDLTWSRKSKEKIDLLMSWDRKPHPDTRLLTNPSGKGPLNELRFGPDQV